MTPRFNSENIEAVLDYIKKSSNPFIFEAGDEEYLISGAKDLEALMRKALKNESYALVKQCNRMLAYYDLVEAATTFRHYPMIMQLEHTSYCNAECIMCIHYYKQNRDAVHLSEDLHNKVRPVFPYLDEIVLHGNGEPFLLPSIGDRLKEYKKYGIAVSTNTNMSVLPDSVLENVDAFKALTVSLDSPRKEIYDVIRKNLDFDKVTQNIDRLRMHAPELHMTLAVVSMRQNIRDSKMLVEYACDHGFNRITFSRMGVNGYIKNWYDDVVHYPATTRRCMSEAIEYAYSRGIEIVYPDVFLTLSGGDEVAEAEKMDSYPLALSEVELTKLRNWVLDTPKRGDLYFDEVDFMESSHKCKGICDLLWDNIMITAKGEVVVCCIDVIHHIDMLNKPLDKIWNGEKYIRLRKMFFEDQILPEYCRNCMFILNNSLRHLTVERGEGFYLNEKKTR